MSKYSIEMVYEFDLAKSDSNKQKHGIDFTQAQRLWAEPHTQVATQSIHGEQRWLVIGSIDGKYWTAAITYRANKVRIISVRRARQSEIALLENSSYE